MVKGTVLVIGATKGIGLAVVEKFASQGYNIVATYNSGELIKASQICDKLAVTLFPVKMDISKFDEVEKGFETAFKLVEKIDCIVCNSGISAGEKLLCDQNVDEIEKLIDVNLKGIIYCNREAQKYLMQQKHGSIINISSIYGIYGGCCEAVYSASKGGIIGLTKSMSDECASFGVRVNCVAPGYVATDMTSCFDDDEKAKIMSNTPLKRLGMPIDIANAVYFLASDEASFITGEILTVSGGVLKF